MISREPPTYSGNLQKYSQELAEFLRALSGPEQEVLPSVPLLRHKIDDISAAVDGILMFCPARNAPVYSFSGQWWTMQGQPCLAAVSHTFPNFDIMFGQTTYTYDNGAAIPGQLWQVGNYVYQVEPENTAYNDYHAITDEGVKLTIVSAPEITPASLNAIKLSEVEGEDITTVIEPACEFNRDLFNKMVPYALENRLWWFWDDLYVSAPELFFDFSGGAFLQSWWRMYGSGGLYIHNPGGGDFNRAMEFKFCGDLTETDNTVSNLKIGEFELRHWSPSGGSFTSLPFGDGLVIYGGFQMRIERLRIQWFRGSGILTKRVWDSRIYDNVIQRCGTPPNEVSPVVYEKLGSPAILCRDGDWANTNSLRIKDNQVESPQGTGIAVGGVDGLLAVNGGGAKHCVLDGNKIHERQAQQDASNIVVFGENTDWTIISNQQISPLEDYGIRIMYGACNTTVDNCEFGNGLQPMQVDSDGGPGVRITNSTFFGRGRNYHVRNLSVYPVFISGNTPYASVASTVPEGAERVCNFAFDGIRYFNNSQITVALQGELTHEGKGFGTIEPYLFKDTRAVDVSNELYLPKVTDANDRVTGGVRYRYSTDTDNTRVSIVGLQAGGLTDLATFDGSDYFTSFRSGRITLQGPSATVSVLMCSGDPNGVINSQTGALALEYGGAGPTLYRNVDGGTKWVPVGPLGEETATDAQLRSASSTINTDNKYAGKGVWASDTKVLYRASGSATVAAWDDISGGASIVPS